MHVRAPAPSSAKRAARSHLIAGLMLAASAADPREPRRLHEALDQLTRDERYSGAVVIYDGQGTDFARGASTICSTGMRIAAFR